MRYLIFSMFTICVLAASAQSNLVFFTEEGENFTLFVNGSQANENPEARVKATGIAEDFAQIKIIFETPGAPEIKKGMMIEPGKEMTSVIKRNSKGKYVLRPVSVSTIISQQSEAVPISNTAQPAQNSYSVTQPASSNTSTDNTETIGINVNMGDQSVGVNVSMSGSDNLEQGDVTSTPSVSTQYTNQQLSARVEGKKIILGDGRVYSFNYYNANRIGPVVEMKNPVGATASISYEDEESFSSEIPFQYNEEDWKKSKVYFKLTVIEPTTTWSVKLKHSGKIIIDGPSVQGASSTLSASSGCPTPMSAESYNRSKESISAKSFSDEQMTVFKQIARSNCFSVEQVIGFIELFTYEEEKLAVAKLAYPKTVDKGNYYQVNDAFTYSDTIEELEDFLSKQ